MKTHVLKIRIEPFWAVWTGRKRYEIRVNDRDLEVGDLLDLREFEPGEEASGFRITAHVLYMTHGGQWGLPQGLCVMSIEVLQRFDPDGSARPANCTCEREIKRCPAHDERGVHFPCEKCGALQGFDLDNGWRRCAACGYPSK